ncbi:heme-thiolate peroxidase [Hysterangium stoloniferum]|nr:heme-thiolate peroxidase [Hysterangium stoloniferum]
MPFSWFYTAAIFLGKSLWGTLAYAFIFVSRFFWDNLLTLLNTFTPRKSITAPLWPDFVARSDTDSRGPCPGLNALSNHGILPHNGRGITFPVLAAAMRKYFNMSSTFSFFMAYSLAQTLRRDYYTDTVSLNDLCAHNAIERDGSYSRLDAYFQPDQSIPNHELIDELLSTSIDGNRITRANLSQILSKRLEDSKRTNPQFTLSSSGWFFGAANCASLLQIFDGLVDDLRTFLKEERVPEGWSTKRRSLAGLTLTEFNIMSLRILFGSDLAWTKAKLGVEGC